MLCLCIVPKEPGAESGDAHGCGGRGTRSHQLRFGAPHGQEHCWDWAGGWCSHILHPALIEHTEGASTGSRNTVPAGVKVEEALLLLGNCWGLKASLPGTGCCPHPPWLSLSKQSLTNIAADVTDLWTTWQTQQGCSNPIPFLPWGLTAPLGEGSGSPRPEGSRG